MTATDILAALTAATVLRVPAGSAATRFITAACSCCGTVTSVAATGVVVDVAPWSAYRAEDGTLLPRWTNDTSRAVVPCRDCGKLRIAKPVVGKTNPDKACNDRCMSATRHVCDCACGGLNHGAAHG